jgi:hypothetical protein
VLKTNKTKQILNEWRKFENRNRLNESQGASVRSKPRPSQRARELLKKLNDKFGSGPFYDYSHFDNHSDDEMISNYQHGDEGIQVEYQEIADFVNSTGEIEISDMTLGDFITAEDDLFYESGIHASDLNIVKSGIANLPSGEYAEFGYVELDDGERIPVVYSNHHGYTIYRFIPVEYDAKAKQATPTKSYKNSLGGAWG